MELSAEENEIARRLASYHRKIAAVRAAREMPTLEAHSDAMLQTPLHKAVLVGNNLLVQLLLASDADVHAKDKRDADGGLMSMMI